MEHKCLIHSALQTFLLEKVLVEKCITRSLSGGYTTPPRQNRKLTRLSEEGKMHTAVVALLHKVRVGLEGMLSAVLKDEVAVRVKKVK